MLRSFPLRYPVFDCLKKSSGLRSISHAEDQLSRFADISSLAFAGSFLVIRFTIEGQALSEMKIESTNESVQFLVAVVRAKL